MILYIGGYVTKLSVVDLHGTKAHEHLPRVLHQKENGNEAETEFHWKTLLSFWPKSLLNFSFIPSLSIEDFHAKLKTNAHAIKNGQVQFIARVFTDSKIWLGL